MVDLFTPEQKIKLAEMTCDSKIKLNNMSYQCCKNTIDGNERVLQQKEINNIQSINCCENVARVSGCCCNKGCN